LPRKKEFDVFQDCLRFCLHSHVVVRNGSTFRSRRSRTDAGQTIGLVEFDGFSDWFTPSNYSGENVALTMPYRDAANGSRDNRPFALYQYTFNLNNSKTVSSITLPANSNVKVLAAALQP
jgi:hypothetical protein